MEFHLDNFDQFSTYLFTIGIVIHFMKDSTIKTIYLFLGIMFLSLYFPS
jgi:hypothetical protein